MVSKSSFVGSLVFELTTIHLFPNLVPPRVSPEKRGYTTRRVLEGMIYIVSLNSISLIF